MLSHANWQQVKAGKPLTVRGEGYWYDEEWFDDIWRFNGPGYGLIVDYEYSNGDMGTGYNGPLGGAHIGEGAHKAGDTTA